MGGKLGLILLSHLLYVYTFASSACEERSDEWRNNNLPRSGQSPICSLNIPPPSLQHPASIFVIAGLVPWYSYGSNGATKLPLQMLYTSCVNSSFIPMHHRHDRSLYQSPMAPTIQTSKVTLPLTLLLNPNLQPARHGRRIRSRSPIR